MKVTVKQSVGMSDVEIIPECEGEECAAQRMTRFYNSMFRELSAYRCEEAEKRRSLRYSTEVDYPEGLTKITLRLILREGGKRVAEKYISHVWKNDVIIHSETSQINI